MNTGTNAAPDREIIDGILNEAKAQAQTLTETAGAAASDVLKKMHEEGESARTEILRDSDQCAAREKIKAAAGARIEARRLTFQSREEAMKRVMKEIEKQLDALRAEPELYRQSLLLLAVEAVTAIGDTKVTLTFSKIDQPVVTAEFLAELKKGPAIASIDLSVVFDETVTGLGLRAASRNGRIIFDNTYRRRLERARTELRARIAKELFNSHE